MSQWFDRALCVTCTDMFDGMLANGVTKLKVNED